MPMKNLWVYISLLAGTLLVTSWLYGRVPDKTDLCLLLNATFILVLMLGATVWLTLLGTYSRWVLTQLTHGPDLVRSMADEAYLFHPRLIPVCMLCLAFALVSSASMVWVLHYRYFPVVAGQVLFRSPWQVNLLLMVGPFLLVGALEVLKQQALKNQSAPA